MGGGRGSARVSGMKSALFLILAALALVAIACEAAVPTPTTAPVATHTPVPTPTPTPIPPDALEIVRATEDNLREASSYRLAIVVEEGDMERTVVVEVVPPDRGRYIMEIPLGPTTIFEMETILIGESQYTLYPGFQAWFSVSEPGASQSGFQGFPYDLAVLRDAVESFELVGEGVIDGVEAYRLTGVGSEELRQAVGFQPGVGATELELWIGRDDLLPLRIETSVEDPEGTLVFVYSEYGAELDISAPEESLDARYLEGLMLGALNPEQLGQLVRAFPVPGQQCIEEEIGADAYREVIGGDSIEGFLVLGAFLTCEEMIFPRGVEQAGG